MTDALQDNSELAPPDLELRESEERFRTAFSQAPIAISLHDSDGLLIDANATCLDMFGAADVEDLKGFELLEDPNLPKDVIRQLSTGQPCYLESEFDFELVKQMGLYATTKSGRCDLAAYISPWQTTVSDRSGFLVHVRDITDRKQAEKKLRESEERFRAIFESAQDSFFIKDRALRYTHVNPALERLLGLSAPELVGQTDDELFGAEAGAAVRQADTRVLAGETIEEEITWLVEGIPTTFHVIKAPLQDDSGDVVGLCGIARDITERVRAEKEIGRLNTELEGQVRQRTAQLQATHEQLNALTYSIAHYLRGPLRAIRGFGEIIAGRHRKSLSREGQHYVANIIQATGRMSRLIDDLLAYSRLGGSSVANRPVQLDHLLAQVKEDLADRIAEAGACVTTPAEAPEIGSDRTLLRGIFTSLLENALTYYRPGVPPQVEVTCQTGADHVIVRVTDNGIGIPLAFHESIFEIFHRLHLQDEYPGTGIGLPIVARSVELLGGRVWVEDSVVDRGSTFAVQLPTRVRTP